VPSRCAATGLAGQVSAPPSQALAQVLQLRELDLCLALGALGVGGEDVEDQRRTVDDLHLDAVLEVAQLCWAQLAVADHGVRAGRDDDLTHLVDLAPADVGRRVGPVAALEQRVEDLGACGLGELAQLAHRVDRVLLAAGRPYAREHDPLQPELPVLDLGDIDELSA
jgi:hypothetical protein